MAQLHQSLISALDDEKNNYTNEKMLKLINKTEVYWFFQEVEKVLTGESNIQRYIESESKKMRHVQKLAIDRKSTFFVQSQSNLAKIITSRRDFFYQAS